MPTFAVTAALPGRAPEMLAAAGEVRSGPDTERMERGDLLALVEGADVAVTMLYDRVDDDLLEAAGPALLGVCNVAVGFDNVDLAACARRGVLVEVRADGDELPAEDRARLRGIRGARDPLGDPRRAVVHVRLPLERVRDAWRIARYGAGGHDVGGAVQIGEHRGELDGGGDACERIGERPERLPRRASIEGKSASIDR